MWVGDGRGKGEWRYGVVGGGEGGRGREWLDTVGVSGGEEKVGERIVTWGRRVVT